MKTKKIILIRHGDYDAESNLSNYGKESIARLAINLLPEIKGKEIAFISSIAKRAVQSAEILKDVWIKNEVLCEFNKYYEIWSGTDAYRECRRLLELEKKVSVYDQDWMELFIKEASAEVIIAVTHLEFVNEFPERFGGKERIIDKGRARILYLDERGKTTTEKII